MMDSDPWGEEDPAGRRGAGQGGRRRGLFIYPGSGHLFADPSLGDYDKEAAGCSRSARSPS